MKYRISNACICCGACEMNCPQQAIVMGDGKYEIDQEKCIGCGTCAAVCPMGAPEEVEE